MFDMSWGEVMVIGAVALIVIGPKDLPKALRTLGNMTAQVRKMAGEFQSQFNEAMREAELEDIKKEVSGLNAEVSSVGDSVGSLNTAFDPLAPSASAASPAALSTDLSPALATDPLPALPAAAAGPMPGEPAFDLALPEPPPVPAGPLPEPAGAGVAEAPRPEPEGTAKA
jgi:sec-independent protein translocase protein TatB